MRLEHLISAVNAEPVTLIKKMKIATDAVLINQCKEDSYEEIELKEGTVRVFCCNEKGVGVSRNKALSNARGDILLFTDEDIVYYEGYTDKVISEFKMHPEADGIFFNVDVCEERRTYYNVDYKRCHIWNAGRYPAYSIALRSSSIADKNLSFSTLFGGGARYSCGEDSIFIKECIKCGLKMYRTPTLIGKEEPRESTWFNGYNDKFFRDRGVMYHFLYGKLALVMGARFIYTKKTFMCNEIPAKEAFRLLKDGIKEGKTVKKS